MSGRVKTSSHHCSVSLGYEPLSLDKIRELFDRLDHDAAGYLDTAKLERAFSVLPLNSSTNDGHSVGGSRQLPEGSESMYADELVSICDTTRDGKITFEEFSDFVTKKDRQLWELFSEIDTKNNHVIGLDELRESIANTGIMLSDADVQAFLDRIDSSSDGVIDFNEWRDYLLLIPHSTNLHSILFSWQTVFDVDYNSDAINLPPSLGDTSDQTQHSRQADTRASRRTDRVKYFLCGGIAGAVSRTVTAPLDRLKVLLQMQTTSFVSASKSSSKFGDVVAALRAIYRSEGLLELYRGNGLNIIKIFPESAIKFLVFEAAKQKFAQLEGTSKDSLSLTSRFASGGIAGLASQIAIYPLETLKVRIMAQVQYSQLVDPTSSSTSRSSSHGPTRTTAYSTATQSTATSTKVHFSTSTSTSPARSANGRLIASTLRQMIQEGPRAFFRGIVPATLGIVPYAAIDLGVFETLKHSYIEFNKSRHASHHQSYPHSADPPVWALLTMGAISGTVGAVSVYPLALIRTRLQAQGTPAHPRRYTGVRDVVQSTLSQEGVRGFYKGLAPTLLKVVPAIAISYVVYERSKRAMGLR